nr:septum site-determining protein Ssd [Kocuria rhizophila]
MGRFTGDERVGHGPASWDGPIAPRQWGRTRPVPAPSRQDRGRGVRLLTSCPDLAEAVEAVCIGVAVPLTVEGAQTGARAASSDVVLVDACWEGEAVPPGAVVVALVEHGDAWDVAARRGASAVVVLPQAAAWLAELISRSVDAEVPRALGRVYGVVGATGGVGASTVASWLAGHFAGQGSETALVDGDPLGAGLDLVLGEEGADGLRWPELNQFSGAVAADQLWAAMPRVEALRYLSWDRRATHAETVPAATVVAALRGAAAVQVVDLSRADLERQARWCDAVLVLTPRTVRGVLAAELALARCAPVPAATALTGVNVADLEPRVLADATGVPCAATIAFDARVPQHLDDGTVLRRGRTAKHAKTVAALARALEGLS